MMWSSIANLKENLNKIALDVHGSDEELEIYGGDEDSSVSDRRSSHSFAHSKSASRSPVANGIDSPFTPEIEQYKAEIKKLQESEAEIKALSVNYAALLKDKEDQISRLNKENGSLKQNLNTYRNDSLKSSANSPSVFKGNGEQSPNRQHKLTAQVKNRPSGNPINNGILSRQDGLSNGIARATHPDIESEMELRNANMLVLLEEKNKSLAAVKASYESPIKQLRLELEKECNKSAILELKLQDEYNLNVSVREELSSLKRDKDKAADEMSKMHNELNAKISEIRRLQVELSRREDEDADDVENLKKVVASLEKENVNLKMEKGELEAALKTSRSCSTNKTSSDVSEDPIKHSNTLNEYNHLDDHSATGWTNLQLPICHWLDQPSAPDLGQGLIQKAHSPGSYSGKEELELNLQKLEKDLKETCQERDKALQQLTRLKQHLLDKESEESEKMDEDSKIIEELRANNEYQRNQILHLEKALKQALSSLEEVKMINDSELQKTRGIIADLNKKLARCMSTIDAKNVELLNLQTALGQYYAEIEAKERLEVDLALAREEIAKLSEFLKAADQQADVSKREKEEILAKLSQADRMLAEGKIRVNKLEEDNAKLRRALEQSMTRLNRMSMDSDYFVDRRIVIKLLVTYFLRNHSKEVLDLMVRMLGFSEEDKKRIGFAQQGAGKGVVRGVLGLPGRLVGGILGGSSAEAHANMASENQSFADLWVDFLLKETKEREKRESKEANGESKEDPDGKSPSAIVATPPRHSEKGVAGAVTGASFLNKPMPQNSYPPFSHGNPMQSVHSDFEFSTVPLTQSESSSRVSRPLPKY
ncbi:golgin candidate 4 isoform X2 [Malania oleifera]|uniref:golgin candidate 4 isoform X2 n=1 Tax=Malania oleifera TaxID=397392 RepID=UPI0025AE207F|nr:golgin candidate 4 isoform X2 [Malania oleifera]